jgi:N-glycosylase/DNA lyase
VLLNYILTNGGNTLLKDFSVMNNEIQAKITEFDLEQTFECGQCFRWNKVYENGYLGVSRGRVLEIEQKSDRFIFRGTDRDTFENYWMDYLDLRRDYGEIIEKVSTEKNMIKATQYGNGIRILLQDEWEALVSFIISSNNNIKRIKKIVDGLCSIFGNPVEYKGHVIFAFPNPEDIYGSGCDDLGDIKCGYRAGYIIDAVEKVHLGEVDIGSIRKMNYQQGAKELMKIKGVGPKVADCVLLYGGAKYESYPVDVWVKRVTEALYLKKDSKPDEIKSIAREMWGDLAGFAQQYLFYYARENQLETGEVK